MIISRITSYLNGCMKIFMVSFIRHAPPQNFFFNMLVFEILMFDFEKTYMFYWCLQFSFVFLVPSFMKCFLYVSLAPSIGNASVSRPA